MFWAIHKKTGSEVNVLEIEKQSDVIRREEAFIARKEDLLNIIDEEIEVKFRLGSEYFYKDSVIKRKPCFYIPNKTERGIQTTGMSQAHKNLQELVWLTLIQKIIPLVDSNKKELIFDFDFSSLKFEETKNNGVKTIRGDVCIDFKQYDETYGKGIIFEVQLSPQRDYIEYERTVQRALNKYSVCWIKINDILDPKTNELKDVFFPLEIKSYYYVLSTIEKKMLNRLETTAAFYVDRIEDRIQQEVKKQYRQYLTCPKCGDYLIEKQGRFGLFYGCNNYRAGCKYTLNGKGVTDDKK
jgi:hypothetical protein